jgi:hypothetical protein
MCLLTLGFWAEVLKALHHRGSEYTEKSGGKIKEKEAKILGGKSQKRNKAVRS